MTFKQLILLTYALTAGALAIGLTSNYTKALQMEYVQARMSLAAPRVVVEQAPTVPVVTVARTVPVGHTLAPDDLVVQHWPKDAAPKGGFASVSQFFAAHTGPVTRSELFEGEPLLVRKIKQAGDGSTLALLLPPDRRAVTIQVNEVRGVGGFVQPKDRVDIILTENPETTVNNRQPRRSARVLLENIPILAVGQQYRASLDQPKVTNSVTVAVTLDEAQKLALATTIGSLSLALRNPGQEVVERPIGISLEDLRAARLGRIELVIHRSDRRNVVIRKVTRTVVPPDTAEAAKFIQASATPGVRP